MCSMRHVARAEIDGPSLVAFFSHSVHLRWGGLDIETVHYHGATCVINGQKTWRER